MMSSGYQSRAPWAPVRGWRFPSPYVLQGDVYKQDEPGFDPIPSVTQMVKTDFCSLLIVHELHHGTSCSLVDEDAEGVRIYSTGGTRGWGVGKLYHQFVAAMKHRVGMKEILGDRQTVSKELEKERERWGNKVDDVKIFVEPWTLERMRRGDLAANEDTYFEVRIASKVTFEGGDGSLSLYMVGKIDELDLKNRKIIERTTRGERMSPKPPVGKDFQVWLLWKILSSVGRSQIREPWREDFKNFDLFVETPHDVYEVDKNQPEFEDRSIRALSLIRDISDRNTMARTMMRIYGESYSSCRREDKHRACGVPLCIAKRRKHPTCRDAIHREFRNFYSSFLWDIIWKKDLLGYQLLMCAPQELRDLEILCEARIMRSERNRMELSLDKQDMGIIRRKAPEERGCVLLIGTPQLGIETDAHIELQNGKAILTYEWRKMPSTERVSLLFPEAFLYTSEPVFLNQRRQRNLFGLERWGRDRDEEAKKDPAIQLLEASFGGQRLDAGGP